ncbi:hypothetical protein [Desulfallas thermosapovorans]|uniref:Uncharacterized protein n=1 Tax=Desulfallas thermosapovorans DSM 6562 TaxID=1121431 RepID=A0A5S5A0Q3_9FIRM|nr:hypothetical protein [Desulfallas thermosapovorans]TYO97877.1 hypothetical protein LX24_00161 [Desulfallas thermosapovorans DSM 6562]
MKISALVFVLVIVLLIVISVRERIRWQTMRDKNWDVIGEAKSSPLSQAITGMVGTAGGIYLSLILMQTFLELQIPRSFQVSGVSLEPLAALSIALAIIQPFAMRLFLRRRY